MSIFVPDTPVSQLQDVPVDKVLSGIDQSLVHLPSYRELYYRWERQQWSTQELDFVPDRIQWEDFLPEEQDMHIAALATFYQGEASVTDALGPYVMAVPDEEMRLFLTTQLVDEARHTVFFNRFFSDVLDIDCGRIEDTLLEIRQFMNQSARYMLIDALTDIATRLRKEPDNLTLLTEGVVLYHLVVEGMMALAGQKSLLEQYRQENLFPAFRAGMIAVTRDESRHVLFGVRFLRDMIQQDATYVKVIETALSKYAPAAISAVTPPDDIIRAALAQQDDPWRTPRYAQESLRKKLKVIGLELELPIVPPAPII